MIKADSIGISFRLKRHLRASVQDSVARLFGGNGNNKFWALDNVSFDVGRGEILGVIGPNGSGKSTLLRVIAGIFPPDRGTMTVNGKVATLLSTTAGFQSDLSGAENVQLSGILMGFGKQRIEKMLPDIIDSAGIGEFIDQPVSVYSSGMTARLGFSIATHTDGDILLIDEVMGAGDAAFAEKAKAKMDSMLSQGKTIVLVSHSMPAIRRFCTRVMWLTRGAVVEIGEPEGIIKRYEQSQQEEAKRRAAEEAARGVR